jgi:hypothetical protein
MKGNRKTWFLGGLIAALVLTVPLYAGAVSDFLKPQSVQAQEVQALQANTVQVVGKGEIKVQPDVAYITMGIQTQGKTGEEAQTANAKLFANLEKLLYETYKLKKEDVQTAGFYVHPDYRYSENGTSQITGYNAIHTVTVTYRDMDSIGALLDDAAKAGVNQVSGVQFGTEKGDEYERKAMEKALANAETKAKALAGYAGKQLGGVIHISETGASAPPIIYSDIRREAANFDAASTSLQIGEITVPATLYVTYELK